MSHALNFSNSENDTGNDLLPGLRMAPPRIAADVEEDFCFPQMGWDLICNVTFAPWETFGTLASNSEVSVSSLIRERKCCSGDFVDTSCTSSLCQGVVTEKLRMTKRCIRMENTLQSRFSLILDALLRISEALCARKRRSCKYVALTSKCLVTGAGLGRYPRECRLVRPDFSVGEADSDCCDVVVNVRKSPPNTLEGNFDATQLCDHFQNMFNSAKRLHKRDFLYWLDWLTQNLCQVVLDMAHTRSGLGCLWTQDFAIFLKLQSEDGCCKVYVSRLFRHDEFVSSFYGLVAIICKGAAEASWSTYAALANLVTRLRVITTELNDHNFDQFICLMDPQESLPALSEKRMALLFTCQCERVLEDEFPDRLSTSIVCQANVGGIGQVAVKRWNWVRGEGLECLLNEIRCWTFIHDRHHELLGDAVPRLVAITEEPPHEAALVTEFVGEQIGFYVEFDSSGIGGQGKVVWYVGEERLDETEVEEINEAATQSLNKLLRRGINHNNLHASKLRVARIKHLDGRVEWHAWWIDFRYASYQERGSLPERRWELEPF